MVQNNSHTEIPRRSITVPCTSGKKKRVHGFWVGALSPRGTPSVAARSVSEACLFYWRCFGKGSTTPQTATKDVGHLSRKPNSRENNQSQDDSETTDGRPLPASFSRPVGK